jgi:hypothetical protein
VKQGEVELQLRQIFPSYNDEYADIGNAVQSVTLDSVDGVPTRDATIEATTATSGGGTSGDTDLSTHSVTELSDVESAGSGYIPTTTERTNWNAAYNNMHNHSNKTVLDGISATDVSNWNTAYNNTHTHSNKTVLDQISQAGGGKILPATPYNNLTDVNAQLAALHTDGNPTFNNLSLTGTLGVTGNATLNNIVQGDNFSSGILGRDWRIDPTLSGGCLLETDNIRARGEIRSHIYKTDITRATSAYLYVSDATEISDTVTTPGSTGNSFTITVKDNVFSSGNRIEFRDRDLTSASLTVQSAIMDVTSSGSSRTLNGKTVYDYTVTLVSGTGVPLNSGDTVVRTSGSTILLDAASAYAPFIELRDGLGNLRSRYGNLNGSYGYTSNLYGLAAGPPTGDHITIDSSNGVRFIDSGGTVRAQFTGGNLSIISGSGLSNFSDAVDWQTQVSGTGKPADNADVTSANPQSYSWLSDSGLLVVDGDSITRLGGRNLDNIDDSTTWKKVKATQVTAGEIVLVSNSNQIKLDATNSRFSINSDTWHDTGIQMEYNSGNPRFHVGNSSNYIAFDPTHATSVMQIKADSISLNDGDGASYVKIGNNTLSSSFGAQIGDTVTPPDPEGIWLNRQHAAGIFRHNVDSANYFIGIYAESRNVQSGSYPGWAGYFYGDVKVYSGEIHADDFVLN